MGKLKPKKNNSAAFRGGEKARLVATRNVGRKRYDMMSFQNISNP